MNKYRKHFLLFLIVFSINFSNYSFAQAIEGAVIENKIDKEASSRRQLRQKLYESSSPEVKQKMDNRKEMFKKLSKEQRELLKQENERHRQEIKKITGFEVNEL